MSENIAEIEPKIKISSSKSNISQVRDPKPPKKQPLNRGRKRFWDNDNQRVKAFAAAQRRGLDWKNKVIKIALREEYRSKEGRNKPYFDGIIPKQCGHGGENPDYFIDESVIKEREENAAIRRELKVEQETKEAIAGHGNSKLRETLKSTVESFGEFLDNDDKPAPTGYVSDLSVSEWLLYYFPSVYGEELYKVQDEMIEFMNKNPWVMIKVFRSAGKTVLALGIIVYMICQDPNQRIFILGEEYKKTVQRVRVVRNMLGNAKIVHDYGYLINDGQGSGKRKGKSTEGMFECHRTIEAIEPTLMAITWRDTQSLGYHYTGGIMDDPWSNKLQTTSDALEKWMEWWGEFQGSLEKCEFLYILCTRKGLKDLYFRLGLEKQFADLTIPLVRKARWSNAKLIEKNGLYTGAVWQNGKEDYELYDDCKGKYSMTELNRDAREGQITYCIPVLRKNKPLQFEMEYQQNPYLPEGKIFKWENIQLYGDVSVDAMVMGMRQQFSSIQKYAIMDAALGESDEADYNVCYVMAVYRRRFFIIDGWMGKWSDEDRENVLKSIDRKYGKIPLYVESDYAQIKIFKDLKRKLPWLTIKEFKSKGKGQAYQMLYEGAKKAAKKGKIHSALSVPVSDQSIYIPNELVGIEELHHQMISFPNCQYFDCIDTLAMGVIIGAEFAKVTAFKVNRIGMGR